MGLLWTIVVAVLLSGPAGAAPDIRTEPGLRSALDALEIRYEAACRELGEDAWRAATDPASPPGARRAEAQRALRELFDDAGLDEIIAYWSRRSTVTSDPALTRRVQIWEKAREVAEITLDPGVLALESSLASRIAGHRFGLKGTQATRADLARLLATEPDAAARRSAWRALAGLAAEVRPEVRKLIRLRADKSYPRRHRYFHDTLYRAEDLESYWLFHMMGLLTARTDRAWFRLVEGLKEALGATELQPWDLDYAMTLRARQKGLPRILETALGADGGAAASVRLLEALGFDLARTPLRLETGAAGPEDLFVPVRIPGDLRGLVGARAGAAGGLELLEARLRLYGRALQAAYNPLEAPMLKGYPWIPGVQNGVYAEGMAWSLGDFTRDPLFLSRILGLSDKDAAVWLEVEKERRLLRYRRLLLGMGIEFTIYVNPDADLDGRYRELASKALGVTLAGDDAAVWTIDPPIVSRPIHYQDEVLAASVSADLHEKLKSLFGEERIGSRKVAPWLIEKCYARGEMGDLQQRLADSIEGGYGFDAMLASIGGDPLSRRR